MTDKSMHPAIPALVDALIGDVFYRTILVEHADDHARRTALGRYMAHAVGEAQRTGRVVTLDDAAAGAALWLLPRSADVEEREHAAKHTFLRELLGVRGYASYARITGFMHARATGVISADAWYLSILGVRPAEQGRGIGERLLAPTIAEADAAGAICWLETFTTAAARFYQRVGFTLVAWHDEPTTGQPYAILRRDPRATP